MDDFLYNLVSVMLLILSIFWVVYALFSVFGTKCFDYFKTSVALIVMIVTLLWDNIIIFAKDEK